MIGYKIIRGAAAVVGKIVYRVKYIGRENEPKEGGFIVIANHSTFMDPLFVACALKRPVAFMAKSELTKNAFMRWAFKVCNVVPINRGESDIAALRKTCDIVNNGEVTGIFPQGTRIHCHELSAETAMPGIGLIAVRSKAPIVPVSICYGKKNDHPTPFKKVKVYIGKPISYEEYALSNGERRNSHEIAEYTFSKVCENFAEHNYD